MGDEKVLVEEINLPRTVRTVVEVFLVRPSTLKVKIFATWRKESTCRKPSIIVESNR